jgi:hypothetical protein
MSEKTEIVFMQARLLRLASVEWGWSEKICCGRISCTGCGRRGMA